MSISRNYFGLDWLRTVSSVGIVMMHMLSNDNNSYEISGVLFETFIPSFTDLVFLFMAISSFGMCCGYYEKVISGKVNWTDFYKKRYMKILPFFSFLVFVDLLAGFSKASLIEAIADISLLFGLFPNNITVIGVGWFLGVVFAFYLIFPFFCVLIENRKRAWFVLIISVFINYVFAPYFGIGRSNIVYCLCYFVAGGLIFLYRDEVRGINTYVLIAFAAITICLYYAFAATTITVVLAVSSILMLSLKINKENKIVAFFSGISMEIYICHMAVFRIAEKLGINTVLGKGLTQYIITVIFVIAFSVLLSVVYKTIVEQKLLRKFQRKVE